MVMHASKHPRLSDGFHDRNEAHPHPFQNVDRFTSKGHSGKSDNQGSMPKHGDHSDLTEPRERIHLPNRDSPNQRSSVSPGSRQSHEQSSPRMYRNKESYLHRQREKQKSLGNSPNENTVNHHGTNSHVSDHKKHIKTARSDQQLVDLILQIWVDLITSILAKAGEWTEHTSSSGKKYYYNCRTEVSQWEKPKEWLEREKLQQALSSKERCNTKESPKPVQSGDAVPSKSDTNSKHSSESTPENPIPSPQLYQHQASKFPDRGSCKPQERIPSRTTERTCGKSQEKPPNKAQDRPAVRPQDRPVSTSTSTYSRSISASSSNNLPQKRPLQSNQPPYSSLARSQNEGGRTDREHTLNASSQNREHSDVDDNSQSTCCTGPLVVPSTGGSSGSVSGLSLATDIYGRLKPLVSYPKGDKDRIESPRVRTTPSPGTPTATPSPLSSKQHHNSQPNQQVLQPPVAHKLFPALSPSLDRQGHLQHHSDRVEESLERLSNQSPISVASVSDLSSPAISQTSPSNHASTTPLQSQVQPHPSQTRCNSQSLSRNNSQSQPGSRSATPTSVTTSVKLMNRVIADIKQKEPHTQDSENCKAVDDREPIEDCKQPSPVSTSPTPSQTSSQSGMCSANLPTTPQKPAVATLTPSLALYYNESLSKHVAGWSSELMDRQAQRLFEDSNTLGAELCVKVSADLKFARSLVRVSEIQATLQEQRILFLRQQAKDLEKLRNENAYMT